MCSYGPRTVTVATAENPSHPLQAVAQTMQAGPGIFDPGSDKIWGVEAVSLFARMLDRVPRGEEGTMRSMGAPTGNGQPDIVWAKDSEPHAPGP